MVVLYIDSSKTIYKEILERNKYTPKLKLIKDIYKTNTKYYRKIRLDGVRVYKGVLYKDLRLSVLEDYYLIL